MLNVCTGQQNSGWKTGAFVLLMSGLLFFITKEGNKSIQSRSKVHSKRNIRWIQTETFKKMD